MQNKTDIETALKKLADNLKRYEKTERYYRGDHDLAFATEKFENAFGELFREFALNLCPAVVDAPKDKLKITNFKVESGDGNLPTVAWEIWQRNRMGLRSGIVHKEALKNGDAYVIVWVDTAGDLTVYPQKSKNCCVEYDEETPGKILWAAKVWTIPDQSANAKASDRKTRLNMFYADRIEKYVSKKRTTRLPSKADDFEEFTGESEAVVKNEYGIVPVFHFANNAEIDNIGQSELESAIPIQNALNKTVLDLMVAMEFAAYKQRWATGIEAEYDEEGNPKAPFMAGIERLWTSESNETRFGSFDSADLEQFLKVKADFRVDMACVTGTPMYYFMLNTGEIPSGESLRKSETRFINKVENRQEAFGAIWEEIMAFALMIENRGKAVRLFTEWADPAPMSEIEKLGNIVVKKEIGISDEQGLIEAGYGETDIKRMEGEKQAKANAAINAFNAGENLTKE